MIENRYPLKARRDKYSKGLTQFDLTNLKLKMGLCDNYYWLAI